MDLVQYVNKVGKQINDSTKVNVEIDNTSVTNIVLLNHFIELRNEALRRQDPTEVIESIDRQINCLKKQINFYYTQDIDDDCILTEVEEHIIQE
jgi:hypothetical protein